MTLNFPGITARGAASAVAVLAMAFGATACTNGSTTPTTPVADPPVSSSPTETSVDPSPATETPSSSGSAGSVADIKSAPLPAKIGTFTLGENSLTSLPEYEDPSGDESIGVGFTGEALDLSEWDLQKQVAADFGEVVDLAGGSAFCWEEDGYTPCYIKSDKYGVVGVTGHRLGLDQVQPVIEEITKALA